MDAMQKAMGSTMRRLNTRGVERVGTRTCEHCESEVPIMQRTDSEGNVHEVSDCLNCDTDKIRKDLPAVEELPRRKARGFAEKFERVPSKILGKTVSQYKAETEEERIMRMDVAEYIRDFGQTPHHSLVLKGSMGVGKSHLAHAAGSALRKKGFITMFISSDDFLRLIKSTFKNEDRLDEVTIFRMIEEVDLLIFDEIGAEYHNRKDEYETWASEQILKVVDLREDKPTIYTTNYNAEQMENKYGPIQGGRIISRMMAGAKSIKVEGRDRRIQEF